GERGGTDVRASRARPPRPQRPEGKDEDEPHGRTESRTRARDQRGPDPRDTEGEDEEAGRRSDVRLVQPLQEDPRPKGSRRDRERPRSHHTVTFGRRSARRFSPM